MAIGIREANGFNLFTRIVKRAAVAVSHTFCRSKFLQLIQICLWRQIDPEEKSPAGPRPRAEFADVFVKRFDDSAAFRADSSVRLDEVRLKVLHEKFGDDGTR